jgi:hypothetical protein
LDYDPKKYSCLLRLLSKFKIVMRIDLPHFLLGQSLKSTIGSKLPCRLRVHDHRSSSTKQWPPGLSQTWSVCNTRCIGNPSDPFDEVILILFAIFFRVHEECCVCCVLGVLISHFFVQAFLLPNSHGYKSPCLQKEPKQIQIRTHYSS